MTNLFNKVPPFQESFSVPQDGKKDISAELQSTSTGNNDANLIFCVTHGAGGNHHAEVMEHLAEGTASILPTLRFSGPMNLKSRIKHFETVVQYVYNLAPQRSLVLGGRSMGARAAAAAVVSSESQLSQRLVLQSYPLVGPKPDPARAQALLDLPKDAKVLFVIGSRDSMCPVDELAKVRKEMKATSWLLAIEGADHGLRISPGGKAAIAPMGIETGRLIGRWLVDTLPRGHESSLNWEEEQTIWSGWHQ